MSPGLVHWSFDPVLVRVGHLQLRAYTVCFVLAFLATYWLMRGLFVREGKPVRELDLMAIPLLISAAIGARLVHCLAYHPAYYLAHPMQIWAFDRGGLASHGGALAIVTAYLWSRRPNSPSFLWLLDRLAIAGLPGVALIRAGNFANSEMLGVPTGSGWGIVFDRIDTVARHPVQLYEALAYLVSWLILRRTYRAQGDRMPAGGYLAQALVWVGTARFVLEFFKDQGGSPLAAGGFSVGQWLSLPMIAIGWMMQRRRVSGAA